MKQTFDLVSHFFALLPGVILLRNPKEYSRILLLFLTVAVIASLAYHAVESGDLYDVLHPIDRFFSCSLILLTFWLYIDNWRKTSVFVIIVMLVFVVLEAEEVVDDMVVEGVLLLFVFGAIIVYFYERCQDEKNLRKNNLKDPFFGSFFITQILAVYFFIVDTDPYYHSLWHLFAFVSLASVLTHSGTTSEGDKTDTALFYLLGSLPSRLFIAWIFIDWDTGDGYYVAWVFFFLAIFMFIGWMYSLMPGLKILWTKKVTSFIGSAAYAFVAHFLFSGSISTAGWILLGSTVASAVLWDKWVSVKNDVMALRPAPKQKYSTLQLNNMVF